MSDSQKDLRVSGSIFSRIINGMGIFTFLGLIASIILLVIAIVVTFREPGTPIFASQPTSIPIDFGEAHSNDDVAIPQWS